jgi:hypothetical protein
MFSSDMGDGICGPPARDKQVSRSFFSVLLLHMLQLFAG